MRGIGIAAKRITNWQEERKENLLIMVGTLEYKAKLSRLINFRKNHPNSTCYARTTLLYCFPLSIMEPQVKKLRPIENPQLSLFPKDYDFH